MAPNWFASYWWAASWNAPLGAPGTDGGEAEWRVRRLGLGIGLIYLVPKPEARA